EVTFRFLLDDDEKPKKAQTGAARMAELMAAKATAEDGAAAGGTATSGAVAAASTITVKERLLQYQKKDARGGVARWDVGQAGTGVGFGSGAVVSPEGLVLTCAHVTEAAAGGSIVAMFTDGREAPLKVVASNSRNDYALAALDPPAKDLAFFELAANDPA